jgi:hypothetical protein
MDNEESTKPSVDLVAELQGAQELVKNIISVLTVPSVETATAAAGGEDSSAEPKHAKPKPLKGGARAVPHKTSSSKKCGYCHIALSEGMDHRPCVIYGYNYSAAKWSAALY